MGRALLTWSLVVLVGVVMVTASGKRRKEESTQESQYQELVELQLKMIVADDRLSRIAKRSCESGYGRVDLCPVEAGTPYYDLLKCILSPLKGEAVSQGAEITFEHEFQTIPHAAAFTSGIVWSVGAGYNLEITEVTNKGLTLKVEATQLFAPNKVYFHWIACDKEIDFPPSYFDDDEHN